VTNVTYVNRTSHSANDFRNRDSVSFWLWPNWHCTKRSACLLQRERARIAMDIHDDLGSRMTQLVLHGEVAQSELPAESARARNWIASARKRAMCCPHWNEISLGP